MKENWAYVGRVPLQKGGLGHYYVDMANGSTTGTGLIYKKPLVRVMPGAVLEVEVVRKDGSTYVSKATFLRMLPTEQSAQWQATDSARAAEYEAEKRGANVELNNAIKKSMEPILRAMRETNGTGRAAIKLKVLLEMERWNRP